MPTYYPGEFRQPGTCIYLREVRGRLGTQERSPHVLTVLCASGCCTEQIFLGTGESICGHLIASRKLQKSIAQWLFELLVAAQAVVALYRSCVFET